MTQRPTTMADAAVDEATGAELAEALRTLRSVRDGDLRRRLDVRPGSPIAQIASVVNEIVDREQALHAELGRVSKAVGRDGRLGARVAPGPGGGSWQRTVESVNGMLDNLVLPIQETSQVVEMLTEGKLREAAAVPVDHQVDGRTLRGDLLRHVRGVNRLTAQQLRLHEAIEWMTRQVAGEQAGPGQFTGRPDAPASEGPRAGQFPGEWSTLIGSMEQTWARLGAQVHELLRVTTAVAGGDLSRKVEGPAAGVMEELKTTINSMVDQLSGFASEVIRVTRELGTEGRLGGQAEVPGADGTWKDLTNSVNSMALNLTAQVRDIAGVTTAVAEGDLSQKITVEVAGEMLDLKETINSMVDQLSTFADEVTRVAREVGTEGRLGGQAWVPGVGGTWKDLTNSVNNMASNLTSQVRNIALVTTAVAQGDLSKKIDVDASGEVLELKKTVNAMVDQLSAFADEVTRVAREVGTEGQLGGQATVPGVAGVWEELTISVNSMASNLTSQVRNIALVTTAVAQGDLSQKITVDARGEILQLKDTVNTMVDQLSAFADEVTRVAREVGTDGQLGGQATVPGVAGTWQRLTESVNQLAGNLTTQVRAIAEVATAVTKGDLTQQIDVDASGEVDGLKDNINKMIANLRETTRRNQDQDWLKGNLARISSLMQGQRDPLAVAQLIMAELTPVVNAQHGAFYLLEGDRLRMLAGYGRAALTPDGESESFRLGDGLVGQVAAQRKQILLSKVPGGYLRIGSGLGSADPASLIVLPVLFENQVLAVIEIASFQQFTEIQLAFLNQIMESVGVTVNTIIANSVTEDLLGKSRQLTAQLEERSEELQSQQEELRRSNAELAEKAALLARQNKDIEVKNSEIEQARRVLQERADQLALASKYKSEFLANMSHELRTPLNSLLILARLLSDNNEGNLTVKQIEFAETIHGAGSDLLGLISDILDLSKIEAGRMDVQASPIALSALVEYVEATFRPLTAEKGLDFAVRLDPRAPAELQTDEQRLQQVLRNLLSNAAKFTTEGTVELRISVAEQIHVGDGEEMVTLPKAVAFEVADTGIGIAEEKLRIIFEAFQQADGTISRKHGGTGLGLSISREIAHLLGGAITVQSTLGRGSVFTLYLPMEPPIQAISVPRVRMPEQRVLAGDPDSHGAAVEASAQGSASRRPGSADARRPQQQGADSAPRYSGRFDGEVVLVVDDDVRNVFALTSVLEQHGLTVRYAENGLEAIDMLERADRIDLVLMDIMMPEMDGYTTMRAVRRMERFVDLPIIALTAKAMQGDREKAIEAGASEYVTKPVVTGQLLDLIRLWLTASDGPGRVR
jgi:signal transduction histidine kinase/HAMP domain-containing protein